MPYESFAFDGLRPRWVKLRDQWWGELIFTLLVISICGLYLYYKMSAIDEIEGVLEWVTFGATFGIVLSIIVYVLRDLYRSMCRRSELIRRWQRYKMRVANAESRSHASRPTKPGRSAESPPL